MKTLLGYILLTFVIFSCTSQESKEQSQYQLAQEAIKTQESLVMDLSANPEKQSEFVEAKQELLRQLKTYFNTYPDTDEAAATVLKIHMLYSAENDTKNAMVYADTLISNYPEFEDRAQIIESQIVNYELMVRPRNKEKIKMYLELWLEENKDASPEKIADMKNHLENIDQPLEERIIGVE